jgi:hypothetical protein
MGTHFHRMVRRLSPKSVAVLCLLCSFVPPSAQGLNEIFEQYVPPQAGAMANALTADAAGYLSNYYNPAGLAKANKRKWEITVLDAEGTFSPAALGRIFSAQSFGIYRLMGPMQANPGQYTYFDFASCPAVSTRGFGASVLANYRYAAQSDGTNIDIDSVFDFGPTVGAAVNFFGNILKLGVAGKAILRNELKGNFALSSLNSDSAIASQSKEGLGLGADAGMIVTLPYRYLPTFGVVVRDIGNTNFSSMHVINPNADGAPDPITQSINAAFSLHPALGKRFVASVVLEYRHFEMTHVPWSQHVHFAVQLESERHFFIWFSDNEVYYPGGGIALRLPGGNLELATYAEAAGSGTTTTGDRRFMFRYTIGF